MTMYLEEAQTCAVCGAVVQCEVLCSTNSFGSPDLDLRPAEMERSTMDVWLQECPKCLFVNDRLEHPTPNAKAILASSRYQQVIADTTVPELARKFARYATLNTEDIEKAGAALLHSAWVCDDEAATERAIAYRSQAADLLLSLQPFEDTEEQVTLGISVVDVLRRALRFSEAKTLARTLFALKCVSATQIMGEILEYQCRLCESGDAACYTVADAETHDEAGLELESKRSRWFWFASLACVGVVVAIGTAVVCIQFSEVW
ncbi:MAG: hypothetical protein V4719_20365 [Planctomycetota bacterium]